MKTNINYTIKDIAQMAGVSRGTVDRVIHGRGIVSKETYDKIKLILEKIDYQPNLAAQSLRKGPLCRIAILVPDGELDPYWERAMLGIEEAIKELSFVGVQISKHLFNSFHGSSFTYNANHVLKEGCDGVLVAPLFYNEAVAFFKKCKEKGIACVTFNTEIKEEHILSHVGQDLEKSGETAASLLKKMLQPEDEYFIVHIDEDIANARHVQEKERGFKSYMAKKGVSSDQIKVLKLDEDASIEKRFMTMLHKNPKVKGVFVSTSKVYIIADLIEAYSLDLTLVGYDLIDENRNHLKKGNIEFLIYQNPGLQAHSAISLLVDKLAFNKDVPSKKLLPIEIVIKENYQDYSAGL